MTIALVIVTAWVFFLSTHIVVWRASPRAQRMYLFAPLTAAGYIGSIALYIALGTQDIVWWVSLPCYLCGVMCYLHWYIGMYRSLSIRILLELLAAPGQTLNQAQLENMYPLKGMFSRRLDLMTQNGWLTVEHGNYRCLRPGVARLICFSRRLYNVKQAG